MSSPYLLLLSINQLKHKRITRGNEYKMA